MTTAELCPHRRPSLREDEVYPTRMSVPIKNTFTGAAIALENYEEIWKKRGETSARMLGDIGTAAQLILDASGYLFKKEKFYNEFLKEETELDYRHNFIKIYQPIFPEVNLEELRTLDAIAPIFAKKTHALADELADPKKLTEKRRKTLAQKLIAISNSIEREQNRMQRYF